MAAMVLLLVVKTKKKEPREPVVCEYIWFYVDIYWL